MEDGSEGHPSEGTRTTGIADVVPNIVPSPQRGRACTAVGTAECTDLTANPRPTIAGGLRADHRGRLGARRFSALFRRGRRRVHFLSRSLSAGRLQRACLDGVVISGASITSGRASGAIAATISWASTALMFLGGRAGYVGRLAFEGGGCSGSRHCGGRCSSAMSLVLV